jgi:hypothetical protein
VRVVRRKIGLPDDGPYDTITAERIRGMAKKNKIESGGEVNADVAEALGESAVNKAGLAPEWFTRDLELWSEGDDVLALRRILRFRTRTTTGSTRTLRQPSDAISRTLASPLTVA